MPGARPWPVRGLPRTLSALRHPDGLSRVGPGRSFQGTLRPYQLVGMQWLHLLARLRLGACLADDMGLGKTIQVLSLLLVLKDQAHEKRKPCLLVAPASLLANSTEEISRFAPSLKVLVAHPSATPAEKLTNGDSDKLEHVDLVVTSYGFLARLPWLQATTWQLAILDEAQAIKVRRQTNSGGEAAPSRCSHCPNRNSRGKPAQRLVGRSSTLSIPDFWDRQRVCVVYQTARRAPAKPLRPPARPGASLYFTAPEDRQEHHCRFARQGRGKNVLSLKSQTNSTLSAGGGRSGRPNSKSSKESSAEASFSPSSCA